MENWIARDQRSIKSQRLQQIVLVLLLAIALALLVIRLYPRAFDYLRSTGRGTDGYSLNSADDMREFARAAMADLGLEHLPINDQPFNFMGKSASYPCYKVSWPKDFPFAWLTSSFQEKCGEYNNLGYDALEIGDNDRLVVKSIESFDSDTLAEFEFVSSSRAIPKVSSISFVFRNFADFKREEALDLIWLNIPFGFVLKADQVPDEAISKALKSSQAQCFLELPADTTSWAVILNGHRLLKNITDNELSDSNLRAILETFPVLDGVYFQKGDDIDRDLVRLIIGLADNLRLTYLLSNDNPGFADSLAYLKGLKIKSMPDIDKDISLMGNELRSSIISRTNQFRQSDKGSYFVSSRSDIVENIMVFLPLFERLNIVITPPLRLAPVIEKL